MKKLLLIAAVLCSMLAQAQEIDIDKKDEFTGSHTVETSYTYKIDNDYSLSCFMRAVNINGEYVYGINLYLNTNQLGCFVKGAKAIILFTDGSTMEINNVSDTDCNETPSGIFMICSKDQIGSVNFNTIMKNNMYELRTKEIKGIRIYGSDYYNDYYLSDQSVIKRHAQLIYEKAH